MKNKTYKIKHVRLLIDGINQTLLPVLLFVALSQLLASTVTAQIQFPVMHPASKVGEIAKYRTVDLWTNSEQSTSESVLVDIETDLRYSLHGNSQSYAPHYPSQPVLELLPLATEQRQDGL